MNLTTNHFSPEEQQQIKIAEVLHLCGNLFSGGLLSSILIAIYLATQNNISPKVRKELYNIINFNISFLLWFFISFCLMILIIGFFALIFLGIIWFILMIIGAIKHFAGDTYNYPMTISFLN